MALDIDILVSFTLTAYTAGIQSNSCILLQGFWFQTDSIISILHRDLIMLINRLYSHDFLHRGTFTSRSSSSWTGLNDL